MKQRRFLAFFLLLAVLLSACTAHDAEQTERQPVTLVYYTIGEPDADLQRVNDALNELLVKRYGFRVDYRKIGWNDYEKRLSTMVNTSGSFDIAFAWTENYQSNARRGSWLDLTPYMTTIGSEMYDAVNSTFWKGVLVSGRIYGVPTNKELATPTQFLFDKRLVEKYDIDITQYRTIASLEPLLAMIAREEPDYIPFFMDATRHNLFLPVGYEYVTYDTVPLVIRSDDPECRVYNAFEIDAVMDELRTLHRYYSLGYINEDASIRTSLSRFSDEKTFLRLSSGGPDSDASYSETFGYPIVVQQASRSVATTDSTRGGVMVVNAQTNHPEECVTFLNAVNTDPEVRNLLNYGIEGVHYTLTDKGQVHTTSAAYAGITYTQGNWFLLYTREGENLDRWEVFKEFNAAAKESTLLGFTPDYSGCTLEFDRIARIDDRYYAALMTGTVDPDDYVPKMNEAFREAGIDDLCQVLQSQIDSWLRRRDAAPVTLP